SASSPHLETAKRSRASSRTCRSAAHTSVSTTGPSSPICARAIYCGSRCGISVNFACGWCARTARVPVWNSATTTAPEPQSTKCSIRSWGSSSRSSSSGCSKPPETGPGNPHPGAPATHPSPLFRAQIMHAEKPTAVAPAGIGAKARTCCKRLKFADRVFVGILGVDALANGEDDLTAGHGHDLIGKATDVHLDAASVGIVERLVAKSRCVEIRIELAVGAREKIEDERRGDAG